MKKIIFAFVVAMIYSCTPVAPTATEENDSTKTTTEVVTDTTTEVVVQEQ